jgi:hypothetical protein
MGELHRCVDRLGQAEIVGREDHPPHGGPGGIAGRRQGGVSTAASRYTDLNRGPSCLLPQSPRSAPEQPVRHDACVPAPATDISHIMPGAEKIDPGSVCPGVAPTLWLSLGLGSNGVHSSLHRVVDRSAMHFELWEPSGAEAEAGLTAAQQRGRTVRFDALGLGGRGRCRLTSAHDLQQRTRPKAIKRLSYGVIRQVIKQVFLSQRNKGERSRPQTRKVVAPRAVFDEILARSAKILASLCTRSFSLVPL